MIPVPLYFVGTSNLHLKIFGKMLDMSKFYLVEEGFKHPSIYAVDGFRLATNGSDIYYVELNGKWYILPSGVTISDWKKSGIKVGIRVRYRDICDTRYLESSSSKYGELYLDYLRRLSKLTKLYSKELRKCNTKYKCVIPHVYLNGGNEYYLMNPFVKRDTYLCKGSIPNAMAIVEYESKKLTEILKSIEVKEVDYVK